MIKLVYIQHEAGTFEDGLQVCKHCGQVITNYTGSWASSDGNAPKGFPEGPVYVTGTNPVQLTTIKPEINYGDDDPYEREVVNCTG